MDVIENGMRMSEQGADTAWLSPAVAERVMAFHRQVPGYGQTELIHLPELAAECGVAELLVKDESSRFGLNAFKGLGGIYAVTQAAGERLGLRRSKLRSRSCKSRNTGIGFVS